MRGNLIIGQSGGPTAVINSSLAGVVEEAQKHPEIEGIYGCLHGVQGLLQEEMVDLEEAYLVGQVAVRAAVEGTTGQMVILVREPGQAYRCTTGLAPLEKVAAAEKEVPPEFINPEGNFVSQAFVDYAAPLVGSLPNYARLEMHRVARRLS